MWFSAAGLGWFMVARYEDQEVAMNTKIAEWRGTLIAALLIAAVGLAWSLGGSGIVHRLNVMILQSLSEHEFELDLIMMVFLLAAGLSLDLVVHRARTRRSLRLERERLRAVKAAMTTVHDIVNNALTNLQLIRFESEDRLTPPMLALLDEIVHNTSAELKALSDIEQVIEQPMAIGVGLAYQRN
jgi:hypothetical protein